MTKTKRKTKSAAAKDWVASDQELMKALVRDALQEILEAEMTEQIGAAPGERSLDRPRRTFDHGRPGSRARTQGSGPWHPILSEPAASVGGAQIRSSPDLWFTRSYLAREVAYTRRCSPFLNLQIAANSAFATQVIRPGRCPCLTPWSPIRMPSP